MAKYYKLGEKATLFFDPTTQVLIRGKEIIEVTRLPKSKKLAVAINQGHVVVATEEEYQRFLNHGLIPVDPPLQPELPPEPPLDLLTLGDKEFKKEVKKFGFVKKDLDAILAAETREEAVELYNKLVQNYD
jgi:hypothetical protein